MFDSDSDDSIPAPPFARGSAPNSAAPLSPSTPSSHRPAAPPPSTSSSYRPGFSRLLTYSANPPNRSHRRINPRGIYLGIWRLAGLPASASNAVYGSRDRRDRINRRISKKDAAGNVVLNGNYDIKKTTCSHANIHYIDKYQGLSKEQVNAAIIPFLRAKKRSAFPTPAKRRPGLSRSLIGASDDDEEKKNE